jgi:hypothetical protein
LRPGKNDAELQTASKSLASRLHHRVSTGGGFGGFFITLMNLDQFIDSAPEQWTVSDPRFCKHDNKEKRRQTHGAIVLQCMDCGSNCSNAISQKDMTKDERESIQPFDYKLREDGWARQDAERKAEHLHGIKPSQNIPDDSISYKEYLRTEKWKAKRILVIQRESNLCEGCRAAPIDEIHHRTYANVGDELLFQLVGLCCVCHSKCHPEKQ